MDRAVKGLEESLAGVAAVFSLHAPYSYLLCAALSAAQSRTWSLRWKPQLYGYPLTSERNTHFSNCLFKVQKYNNLAESSLSSQIQSS